ncbi:hypothetical protein VTL71DRAFT_13532 [Oculimacula yallundae]|uniref:BTB domain-containing protein n=1 Tax=Oculimacula yallundae TaxID=86028 RepID=A0ABR4CMA1_9HELO
MSILGQPGNSINPNSIVFAYPGLDPDLRLRVLDVEYHVHSAVSKHYSYYFRQFLDSPDKPVGPASALFYYDYVSVFDDDGLDWSLQPVSKTFRRPNSSPDFDSVTESEAFGKYLCALYTRPYVIKSCKELTVMTRIADYYCTLPILSSSLTAALFKSPVFDVGDPLVGDEKSLDSFEAMISISQKLHHAELFRECFIQIVSLWRPGNIRSCELLERDSQLFTLIQSAYLNLAEDVLRVQRDVMFASLENKLLTINITELLVSLVRNYEPENVTNPLRNASYFRKLKEAIERIINNHTFGSDIAEALLQDKEHLRTSELWQRLMESIKDLLMNNLRFTKPRDLSVEHPYYGSVYGDEFLCATISDEDLPWDRTVVDW